MFSATKVRAKITDTDPVFKVRYIGCTVTYVASGTGCTVGPVQKLWDNAGAEKDLNRISIIINTHGIIVKSTDKKSDLGKLYEIENISFCNADSVINERIFSWIYKDNDSPSLYCHAVICSNKEKAKSMALVCSRAFQIAYKEWKTSKTREIRESRKGKLPDQILEKSRGSISGSRSQTDADSIDSEHGSSKRSISDDANKNDYSRKDSYCQTDVDNVTNDVSNNLKLNGTKVETIAEVTHNKADVGVQGDLNPSATQSE